MIRLAFAVLLALLAAPALAETPKGVPESPAQVRLSLAPVVRKAQPAVVNVYVSRVQQAPRNPLFDDPIFRRFFGGGGGDSERVQRALGSGVIVDRSGLVVTNNHVVEGMTDVKVTLSDKREYAADVVLADPRTDLAVLKIKGGEGEFPVLEMGDSDGLEVGDFVIAIGDPFGVGQTVTQGIVSALARTQIGANDYGFFIQTDAAINPGNSGGALVDMDGRLVGVNSMIYSRSGGSMGLGFAIPVNMVKSVVAAARTGGKTVRRPWLGATLQNVSKDIADTLGLDRPTGALVAEVESGGPAAEAGVKRGDVIAAVDGQVVEDAESLGFRLGVKPIGGAARLKVLRDGKALDLPLRLVSAPEVPPRDAVTIRGRSPFEGARVMNLSPAVIEELSLGGSADHAGVVVAGVADNSTAASVGVQKGDVVVEVNGQRIETTRDLANACAERARWWDLIIRRGGQTIHSQLGG